MSDVLLMDEMRTRCEPDVDQMMDQMVDKIDGGDVSIARSSVMQKTVVVKFEFASATCHVTSFALGFVIMAMIIT